MIKLNNISVKYDKEIIHPCDISFEDGKLILIKGESGAGKTSLLYRIGCISKDIHFEYDVNGQFIKNEKEKEKLRRINYGYVLQESSLFEQYDVIGNMQLYASLAGYEYSEKEYQALLDHVHVHADIHQTIETLSGGERQRLAIACALCKQPDVLILDEITSSLDKENELHIFDILKELAHKQNKCIILASHSKYASDYADKVYAIHDKELICEKDIDKQMDVMWKTKESPLKMEFYKNYLIYFMRKYKKLNTLILSVMVAGFLLCLVALGLFRVYANASLAEFSKLYQPRILFTNKYGSDHLDNIITMFQPEKQAMLDEIDVPYKAYPMISANTIIDGQPITILPYFEENELDGQMEKTLGKEGLIFSKEAYDLIQKDVKNDKISLNVQIYEHLDKGQNLHQEKEVSSIKGILKSNVDSPYTGSKLFVYMPYSQMEAMYKKQASSEVFVGKILLFENYPDVKKVEDQFAEEPIGVNKDFCDILTIMSIIHSIQLVKVICMGMLFGIFILMFSAFQMNYLYKRNKEFALLVINGMRRKHLQRLLLLETVFKFILSICSAIVITLIITGVVYVLTKVVFLTFGDYIMILIIGCFTCVIVSWIFSKLYLDKLIPEAIIRN